MTIDQIFEKELQLAELRTEHPNAQDFRIEGITYVVSMSPKPKGSGESGGPHWPSVMRKQEWREKVRKRDKKVLNYKIKQYGITHPNWSQNR